MNMIELERANALAQAQRERARIEARHMEERRNEEQRKNQHKNVKSIAEGL